MTYMLDTNICIYTMKRKPEKVLQRFQKALDEGLWHLIHYIGRAGIWYAAQL